MVMNVNSEHFKAGNNCFKLSVIGSSLIYALSLLLPFYSYQLKHSCYFCQCSFCKYYKWNNDPGKTLFVIFSSTSSPGFAHGNKYCRNLFLTTVKKSELSAETSLTFCSICFHLGAVGALTMLSTVMCYCDNLCIYLFPCCQHG